MNYYNCIYMYINKINGKRYIGQTIDFNRRHKEHKNVSSNKTPIDLAFNKYGEDNFEIIILAQDIQTKEQMNEYEIFFIERYRSLISQNGYNVSKGGGNYEVTDEFRKQCSERNKGENNYFHSHIYKGEENYFYGKHHSEETKQILSKKWKDKYDNGYINPNLGKPLTEEHKQKMRNTIKEKYDNGYIHPRLGIQHTEETKQKMKKNHADFKGGKHPRAKAVLQYNLEGDLIKEWECINDIVNELHFSKQTIRECCNGGRESHKGFVFKWKS